MVADRPIVRCVLAHNQTWSFEINCVFLQRLSSPRISRTAIGIPWVTRFSASHRPLSVIHSQQSVQQRNTSWPWPKAITTTHFASPPPTSYHGMAFATASPASFPSNYAYIPARASAQQFAQSSMHIPRASYIPPIPQNMTTPDSCLFSRLLCN